VSWEHAELRFDGQTAVLRDLKSTNGVLVDGSPVSEALIEDGQVIRLGDFVGVSGSETVDAAGGPLSEAEQLGMHVGLVLRAALQPLLVHSTSAAAARPVVLEGETGTGKRLTARLCHRLGQRTGEFVPADCGADDRAPIPELLPRATGGTLYLASIAALPLVEQDQLAAALADGADVALVAGSQEPLATAVAEGRLARSLYQQLDGVKLRLPPLRRRVADIVPLAEHVARYGTATGRVPSFSEAAQARLVAHPWPGTVRELGNVVTRATMRAMGPVVTEDDVLASLDPLALGSSALDDATLWRALAAHAFNKTAAARTLGIPRSTLRDRLAKMVPAAADAPEMAPPITPPDAC
jgi:DNA-binding NtrC family response regulator